MEEGSAHVQPNPIRLEPRNKRPINVITAIRNTAIRYTWRTSHIAWLV